MHMVGKQSIMLAVSSWARDESLLGVLGAAVVVFSSLRPRMELITF